MRLHHKIKQFHRRHRHRIVRVSKYSAFTAAVLVVIILILPLLVMVNIEKEQTTVNASEFSEFPVTVDPTEKKIIESDKVNNYLEGTSSPLQASVLSSGTGIWNTFKQFIITIGSSAWYQNLASVVGVKNKLVTIPNGMRKEQVASIFGKALSWNEVEREQFLTPQSGSVLPFMEGSFSPGTYVVNEEMTPLMIQELVNDRFTENVLSRYGEQTAARVPLGEALIIASIIQRETIGNEDMRLVSGILWNRLFINMHLQVDATLQYAKASTRNTDVWWPSVVSSDKYINSPYNTYMNAGLPPTAIASPSVGAILAALNPIKTDCIYYFNDRKGDFHCSETYKEHVAGIKRVYGQ